MSTSETPTVSAVIATYNKSAALRCAIESVLWQTFTDFELWVIGDCCTDDSEQITKSFGDPRVKWHNLAENSGYASAPNNEGIRRAKGKYIAYLNHDDLWLPNHLQVLVDCIEVTGADFVFSIMEMVMEYDDPWPWIPHYPNAPLVAESSHTLHRRDVIRDLGYWKMPNETSSWPRREYFRRAHRKGKTFVLAPQLTAVKIVSGGKYSDLGRQPEFLERIRKEPDFASRELAGMLVRAHHELEKLITPRRLSWQIRQAIKRRMLGAGIDPARLRFWRKLGQDINDWRKDHNLNPLRFGK
jgi:glycosyltransferase involved in cell wall biosynthesis